MSWIKSEYVFHEGRAVFYVTAKHMLIERAVFEILKSRDDPSGLENAVSNLIQKYRPELAGCTIYHMTFNAPSNMWEFAVIHPSLPRVGFYEEAPRRPLDPSYERDVLATQALGDE